jgi:hypothetical protein
MARNGGAGRSRPKVDTVAQAREQAEAKAKAAQATVDARLAKDFAGETPGIALIRADIATTVVFGVAALASVLSNSRPARVGFAWLSVALFAVGVVLFGIAFFRGAQRSRTNDISMAGLWFLSGSAPQKVRLLLNSLTVAQTAIALTAASVRPFTSIAFGVLVPMFGLGAAGAWGALHGSFEERR